MCLDISGESFKNRKNATDIEYSFYCFKTFIHILRLIMQKSIKYSREGEAV